LTRFLSSEDFSSKALWSLAKSTIRAIEMEEGIIVFDNSMAEKPYADENELIC
jgi:hypothetical protein